MDAKATILIAIKVIKATRFNNAIPPLKILVQNSPICRVNKANTNANFLTTIYK